MAASVIEADYLIKGAGAVGIAFADSLVTHSDATMVIVDRHDRPGGHWNDAYPFVRLHQPSSTYGAGSATLGSGSIDHAGLNAGLYELASGHEVISHFDTVMHQHLLASGRVRYLPMSEVTDDGMVESRLSGRSTEVRAKKFVDATHSKMEVPSTSAPKYGVADGVACVPPNDLPRVADRYRRYVVVGGGKTGMDACFWLLVHGADPDTITWIVPRDSWTLNRKNFQPGPEFFGEFCRSIADQVEAVALASSLDEVFEMLEGFGELRRIDPDVVPDAYHCAILSDGELAELRKIANVVRMGRVVEIDAHRATLERGTFPSGTDCLYVDCSAAGIPGRPSKPIFDGDRITPQWVRTCQPTFSAALVGFVEATFADETEKNRICRPIAPPTLPADWLRMLRIDLRNRKTWTEYPEIQAWLTASRLDGFNARAQALMGVDPDVTTHIQRYVQHVGVAASKIDALLDA